MPDYGVVFLETENPEKLPHIGLTEFNTKVRELIEDGYTCIGAPFKEYVTRNENYSQITTTGSVVTGVSNTKVCVIMVSSYVESNRSL